MLRSYRGRPAQRPGFLPAPPAEAPVLQGRAVDLAVLRRIGRRGPQHAPSVRKRWFGGGGGGARRSRGGGRRTRKPGQALRGRADRRRPGCSHALIGRRNPWQAVRRPATSSTSPRLSAVPLRSKHLRRRSEGRQTAHWLTGQGRRGGARREESLFAGDRNAGAAEAGLCRPRLSYPRRGPCACFISLYRTSRTRTAAFIRRSNAASLISRSSHCCYPRRMRARIPLPAPALGSIIGGSGLR